MFLVQHGMLDLENWQVKEHEASGYEHSTATSNKPMTLLEKNLVGHVQVCDMEKLGASSDSTKAETWKKERNNPVGE